MTHRRIFVIGRRSDAPMEPALVGAKAVGLARLNRLGLRVPPALVLSTDVFHACRARGSLPDDVLSELDDAIQRLERDTGLTLGGRHPLIVSVRASPPSPAHGPRASVLNVGLTEQTVAGLIRRTGNPWLAWDSYRRLIGSFAHTVGGHPQAEFEARAAAHLAHAGAATLDELDAFSIRDLARESIELLRSLGGQGLPQDAFTQLVTAIESMCASWDDRGATALLVQAMVFGNAGSRSGSGVACTRDPSVGRDELYVDFAMCAQGDDVISGRAPTLDPPHLAELLPDVWAELQAVKQVLEGAFLDMQEFEFTVEEGVLHLLQTRDGRRTAWAALQIARDLARSGVIEQAVAVRRLASFPIDDIERRVAAPGAREPIARATAASPGIATGRIAFDDSSAQDLARTGPVILVRSRLTTDEGPDLAVAAGLVAADGGRTSHAAAAAREHGKVCLVGCRDLRIDDAGRGCRFGVREFREGDLLTLDGQDGFVYAGEVPAVVERPDDAIASMAAWRADDV